MNKEELIGALSKLPAGIDIRIVDWKLNSIIYFEEGESGAGLYDEFDLVLFDEDMNVGMEEAPFAALVFHNPDIIVSDG